MSRSLIEIQSPTLPSSGILAMSQQVNERSEPLLCSTVEQRFQGRLSAISEEIDESDISLETQHDDQSLDDESTSNVFAPYTQQGLDDHSVYHVEQSANETRGLTPADLRATRPLSSGTDHGKDFHFASPPKKEERKQSVVMPCENREYFRILNGATL